MNDENLQDSGARLRDQYRTEGGTGAIFGPKLRDYAQSRPGYPAALFDALDAQLRRQLCSRPVLADIGAGTGLLTRGLLARGWVVQAVEPDAAMRAFCDAQLGGQPGYRSHAGRAEDLPLPPASIDLICAAQAFHWFEIAAARAEALRVLRPQGQVALIWNDRVPDAPLHRDLDALFAEFGGAKRAALVAHEDRSQAPQFFGAGCFAEQCWPHRHRLSEPGLAALVFSRSYMPARDSAAGQAVLQALGPIFQRHADGEMLAVDYRSVAIVGRPA